MKLHARFYRHRFRDDCLRYDPHGFGLKLISGFAYLAEQEYTIQGVSMAGAIVRHHKDDGFGHEVSVSGTREQWDAVRRELDD